MRRRDFIAGLGSAAAWPMVARAQPAVGVRRVGILMPVSRTDATASVDAFKRRLAGLGWAEGRNIRFVERYATESNELAVHAAELARLAPDASFVFGNAALRATRDASGDIPIVFAAAADPGRARFRL